MISHTFTPLLTSLGLDADEATVYETLLTEGALTARELSTRTPLSRTLLYHILERLVEKKIALRDEVTGKVATFSAVHPKELEKIAEERKRNAEQNLAQLRATMPDMSSLYNLGSGKPNVQFFEGMEGVKRCLDDALTSRTEILSYLDIEAVDEHIPEINREYAKARQSKGIHKKNISTDTPGNRFLLEGYFPSVTEERLLPMSTGPKNTVMQMYDGRVSYFTLGVTPLISVIISDPHIYAMHKELFQVTWGHPNAYNPKTP